MEWDNLINVNMASIHSLVSNNVSENLQLEYKSFTFTDGCVDENAKKGLEKAITALANAEGGNIVIGIRELKDKKGIEIIGVGCPAAKMDEITLSIQQRLLAKVRPRLYGISMKAIEMDPNNMVIVIRVAKSVARPHAVNDGNQDVFYLRHSNGTTFMSVDDLRQQFIASSSQKFEIRQFRQERIGMILTNETVGNVGKGAKFLIHVIPAWSLDPNNSIDLEDMKEPKFFEDLQPEHSNCSDSRFNADGFCAILKDTEVLSYCQVFRNGITETLDARLMHYAEAAFQSRETWNSMEKEIVQQILYRTHFLTSKGIPKPWFIFISLLDVKGHISTYVWGPNNFLSRRPLSPIEREIVHATECVWDEDDQKLEDVLRPALDSLANAFGLPVSPNYDKDGSYNFKND